MDLVEAIAFLKSHGIVLVSANGPLPRLVDAIAGERIRGSWWGHPQGKKIFHVLRAMAESEDVLVCKLCGGRLTLVHRRLWPALVRAAAHFSPEQLAKLDERHTASGNHVTDVIAFPDWISAATRQAADRLTEADALAQLHYQAAEKLFSTGS